MYLCFVIINTLTIYKSNELKNLFVQLLHLRNICGIYLKTDKKKKKQQTLPYTGANHRNIRKE